MIYNSKILDGKDLNYKKLDTLFDIKKYLIYALIAFFLSRINLLYYIAPIGLAFTFVSLFRNNKFFTIIVGTFSIIGYLSIKDQFQTSNLYIILNLIMIFISIFFNVKKKYNIIILSIMGIIIYLYKCFYINFDPLPSLFFVFIEIGIIYVLYFIFNMFMKVVSYFNTNHIFLKEEVICLIITVCLIFSGFNGIKIFNIDISNILLVTFILIMSYMNGISVGMICSVFSGGIIGSINNNFSEYIAIYTIISLVASFLYSSSRITISIISFLCILILKLSTSYFINPCDNLILLEILIGNIIFILIPSGFLNKILIYFNEEHKKEFYAEKRLFNTLDLRIQKINDFNDIIKELSLMIIPNDSFKYNTLDKKIYAEILAESVCSNCSKVNICWKNNIKEVRSEMIKSLDNFISGEGVLTPYMITNCILKDKVKSEIYKISNFYNMQKIYDDKIYEAQDILSYELKNLHNIINQSIKEVRKDIVVKVNYEKILINKFSKFNIKYFDLMCYEEGDKIRVKIILSNKVFREYKNDILDIINLSLDKKMILREDYISYMDSRDEVVVTYVEKYNYNVISHALQISKAEKNGDSYLCTSSQNNNYLIILSDGIGSGEDALNKSKFTIDLIYKFIKTNLSLVSSIKEIISIISLKFFRDESLSTIDFSSIDLYTGKMSYLKFSSVITYVKRGKEVFVLGNTNQVCKFDIKDNIKIFMEDFDLNYGDIIVHLTDGLIHFNDLSNKAWLYEFLKKSEITSPDKLCEEIIREFKVLNRGSYSDDITVIVSKVYKN